MQQNGTNSNTSPAPDANLPSVEAVVIGYNGKDFIGSCLQSLLDQDYPNLTITLIDNDSADGTAEFARQNFAGVDVVASSENLGFSGGNNRAFERSDADYFFLLNQDAVADRSCVSEVVAAAETDSNVAAVGAKMLMMRSPSIINSTGIEVNEGGWAWDKEIGERDDPARVEPESVFGACGGAMLLRAETIRRLGGFDLAYFMYFEDVDLCWRFQIAGMRVLFAPKAFVVHDYHGDGGTPDRALRRRFLCERNRFQVLLKNYEFKTLKRVLPQIYKYDKGRLQWLHKAARTAPNGDELRQIARIIRRARRWNLLHLPSILRRRRQVQKLRVVSDEAIGAMIHAGVNEGNHVGDLEQIHDRSSANPSSTIRMGTEDNDSLGPGWYGAEGNPTMTRWSKGEAWFYLRFARGHTRVILRAACDPTPARVDLLVEGASLAQFEIHSGMQDFLADLPDSVGSEGEVLEFCIRTTTFKPSELNLGPDQRTLGINVQEMRLEG